MCKLLPAVNLCGLVCPCENVCKHTRNPRLLGSVTGRESTLSMCEREGGHNCRFSDEHEENSRDDISLPRCFCARSLLRVKTFQRRSCEFQAALLHLIVALSFLRTDSLTERVPVEWGLGVAGEFVQL